MKISNPLKNFTPVEIMIVVAILAILAAIIFGPNHPVPATPNNPPTPRGMIDQGIKNGDVNVTKFKDNQGRQCFLFQPHNGHYFVYCDPDS